MRASNTWILWPALGAAALVLAGCASTPAPVVNHSFGGSTVEPAGQSSSPATPQRGAQTFGLGGHANGTLTAAGYTVARGDTLYSVAFAHGMDVREIASLNGIAPPYTIHPGQVLKLRAAGAPGEAAPIAAAPVVATVPPPPQHKAPPAAQPSAPVFGPVTTQPMTPTGVAEAQSEPPPASTHAPVVVAAPPPKAAPPASPVVAPVVPPAVASAPVSAVAAVAPPPASAPSTAPPGATRSVAGITWRWPASGKVVGGFQAGSGGDLAGLNITGSLGEPVRAAADGTVVYSGNGLIGYGELIIIKHNDTYLSAYGHNSQRLVKEGQHVSAGEEIALMGASGAPRVELHFEIRKDGKPVDPAGYLPAR